MEAPSMELNKRTRNYCQNCGSVQPLSKNIICKKCSWPTTSVTITIFNEFLLLISVISFIVVTIIHDIVTGSFVFTICILIVLGLGIPIIYIYYDIHIIKNVQIQGKLTYGPPKFEKQPHTVELLQPAGQIFSPEMKKDEVKDIPSTLSIPQSTPLTPSKSKNVTERMQKLHDLKSRGLISEEEYQKKKEELIKEL